MELEDQVCSLELSKQLKELGIKQDSYFSWYAFENPLQQIYKESDVDEDRWRVGNTRDCNKGGADWVYSAFTVAELGSHMFPIINELKGNNLDKAIQVRHDLMADSNWFELETEANVRAKMFIYLIENELIKL